MVMDFAAERHARQVAPVNLVVTRAEPTNSRAVFEAIIDGFGDRDEFVCDERSAWIKHRDAIVDIDWHPKFETIAPGREDDPLSAPCFPSRSLPGNWQL